MGFFDDLEKKAAPVPDALPSSTDDRALGAALDRVVAGWVWEDVLTPKVSEEQRKNVIEQKVRLAYEGGRFLLQQSVTYGSQTSMGRPDHLADRSFDREGLLEVLRDQPRLGQRLADAAKR